MTSRYEGFGMVLIEAMICGLPCISFDCPYGPSEIIDDNKDGYLIPAFDIPAFADKICMLIKNQELRKEIGNAAHQKAMQYSLNVVMQKWENLLKEI